MKDTASTVAQKRGRPRVIADADRRLAIIRGASDAFLELGFAGTTTAVVAARAKVSKRSIYETFANKTELFAAVIREHQNLIVDLPRPDAEKGTILDILIRIFRLDVDDDAEYAREAILNLIVRESVLFPELSDYLYENEVIRSRELLVAWLQLETRNGRIPAHDPMVCAGMLMDIVFGALLPRRRLRERPDRDRRTAHITARLAIFLRGIGVRAREVKTKS
ncbi:TetR/AcrR family transcriptional regulator [Paraburkholderia sp.]|uniref:TetR/AcrR family transcriptional regulator n=1 Tax=Paraburkholderia sp. TaxID=1926495 RepID=UPI0023899141|nr:TetR/AcrR family transcriptional regulator [Paraburkholderia sp.]MDE1179379.1 TetR/AcrR family transcriptional regulator [Paraburkholderia sp.]